MNFKAFAFAAVVAAGGTIASTSFAATMDAVNFNNGTGSHALWFSEGFTSGLGYEFNFDTAAPGTYDTSTANPTLTGSVLSDNAAGGFTVDVTFSQVLPGVIHYKQEGGKALTTDSSQPQSIGDYFMVIAGGTLTGTGSLLGYNFDITQYFGNNAAMPVATQVGDGWNAKNANEYGLASWITLTSTSVGSGNLCNWCGTSGGGSKKGDFNLALLGNVSPPPPPVVPLPAGAVLLLTGMGALALRKRMA